MVPADLSGVSSTIPSIQVPWCHKSELEPLGSEQEQSLERFQVSAESMGEMEVKGQKSEVLKSAEDRALPRSNMLEDEGNSTSWIRGQQTSLGNAAE